jgi:type II secretory pathway pseudopilin PulG
MADVILLLAVALIGGVSAVSLKVAKTIQQRSAEAEFVVIGLAFHYALKSYADATPNGLPNTPENLTEFLKDPRYPGVKRHLRRLYHDPLTGKAEWGILRGPDQRIYGIHSLSRSDVFKQDKFPAELVYLNGKAKHTDWVFSAIPQLEIQNK